MCMFSTELSFLLKIAAWPPWTVLYSKTYLTPVSLFRICPGAASYYRGTGKYPGI